MDNKDERKISSLLKNFNERELKIIKEFMIGMISNKNK